MNNARRPIAPYPHAKTGVAQAGPSLASLDRADHPVPGGRRLYSLSPASVGTGRGLSGLRNRMKPIHVDRVRGAPVGTYLPRPALAAAICVSWTIALVAGVVLAMEIFG